MNITSIIDNITNINYNSEYYDNNLNNYNKILLLSNICSILTYYYKSIINKMKTIYSFIYYIKFVMSLYFIFNDNLNVYSELLFISNLIELSSHNFYNNNILFNSVSKICSFIFLH